MTIFLVFVRYYLLGRHFFGLSFIFPNPLVGNKRPLCGHRNNRTIPSVIFCHVLPFLQQSINRSLLLLMRYHFFILFLFCILYTQGMMSLAISYYLLYDCTGNAPLNHPRSSVSRGCGQLSGLSNRANCGTLLLFCTYLGNWYLGRRDRYRCQKPA